MNGIHPTSENEALKQESTRWIPFVLFALWVLALGSFLWPACYSPLPPLYDSIGYAAKAKNVWASISEGKTTDLLGTPPSIRPPGTVLMSYPFGYSENTQGFYFRSIFIPCCLFGIATYMAAMAACIHNSKSRIFAAIIAICATTLPLFFQFHLSGNMFVAYWGLVDGFIGAVSAFAVAILLYANATQKSRLVKFAGLGLAAFCIYIKPAGVLVFGICAAMYFLMQWIWIRRQGKAFLKNALLDVGLVLAAGSLMIPAFLSAYLGPENRAYGEVAAGILKGEMFQQLTLVWIVKAVFHLVGWIPAFLLALALLTGILGLCRRNSRDWLDLLLPLVFSMIWLGAGLAFLLQTSIEQVRYAFPFWLPAIVCLTVVAFRGKTFLRHNAWSVSVCGLVITQVASLLDRLGNCQDQRRPSILAGWNTRDVDVPELAPFYNWLSAQSLKYRQKKILYDAALGNTSAVLSSAIYYDSMVTSRYQKNGFFLQRRASINWERPSGVYLKELVDVDFILTNKSPILNSNSTASRQLAMFQNGVVRSSPRDSGLVPTPLAATAVIYEIVDREAYKKWLSTILPAGT